MKTRGGMVTIKPGQMWFSYNNIANRWGWSKNKVRRFFAALEKEEMVTVHGTTNGTLLTLVNYDNFNIQRHTNETPNETPNGPANGPTNGTQTIMNNNVKNVNNPPLSPQGDIEIQNEERVRIEYNNPEFYEKYKMADGWENDGNGYIVRKVKKRGKR